MKSIAFALAVGVMAGPALAGTLQWVSAPVFVGQLPAKDGLYLTYYPSIVSITPDAQGYYEVWTQRRKYQQESYADHEAIQERAMCNATGDNSCVNGKPGWIETLQANPVYPPIR